MEKWLQLKNWTKENAFVRYSGEPQYHMNESTATIT